MKEPQKTEKMQLLTFLFDPGNCGIPTGETLEIGTDPTRYESSLHQLNRDCDWDSDEFKSQPTPESLELLSFEWLPCSTGNDKARFPNRPFPEIIKY
jgi:hypothetical protein